VTAAQTIAEARGPLAKRVIVAYSLPSIALYFTFTLLALYFFKFATDVMLIAPGLLGGILAAGRLWDGFTDPLAGTLSDRTRASWGRRRSWIAWATLPFAGSMAMLWMPPEGLAPGWAAAWVSLGLLCFYTSYTALSVPYGALGAELSLDYHERTRIYAYRQAIGSIGMGLAIVAYYLFLESQQPGHGQWGLGPRVLGRSVGIVGALILCSTVGVMLVGVRERPEFQSLGTVPMFRAFRDVLRNPHARVLLLAQAAHFFSLGAMSIGAAFIFDEMMGVPPAIGAFMAGCFALGTLGGIPLWARLARRFGKDRCWRFALYAVSVFYAGLFFTLGNSRDLVHTHVLLMASLYVVVLAALQASNFVLSNSMQADVIDWDQVESGQRKEGTYLAAWNLAEKCAGALAAVVVGLALELTGYEANAESQADAVRIAVLSIMSWLPAGCHLLAGWVMRGYRLDQAEHTRIRAVLDARAGEG
jgi:GPH family glycoside/pentoside/hexuronide:cation symporter